MSKRKREEVDDESSSDDEEPPKKTRKSSTNKKCDAYFKKNKNSPQIKIIKKFREILLFAHKDVKEEYYRMPVYTKCKDFEKGDFYIGMSLNKKYLSIYFAYNPYVAVTEYISELKKNKKIKKLCTFGDATVKIAQKTEYDEIPFSDFEKVFKKAFKNE